MPHPYLRYFTNVPAVVGVFSCLGIIDRKKFHVKGSKMLPVGIRKLVCEFKQVLLSIIRREIG